MLLTKLNFYLMEYKLIEYSFFSDKLGCVNKGKPLLMDSKSIVHFFLSNKLCDYKEIKPLPYGIQVNIVYSFFSSKLCDTIEGKPVPHGLQLTLNQQSNPFCPACCVILKLLDLCPCVYPLFFKIRVPGSTKLTRCFK